MTTPTRVPSGVGGGEPLVDVVCPGCGAAARVRAERRSASDFCARCDHPLFWAGTVAPAQEGERADGLEARFRAPGVAGTVQHGALPCPACGEGNHPTWSRCVRCGADLAPPPPPAPEPVPAPVPPQVVTVERPVPCAHPPVWVVVLVTAVIASAATAAVFLLSR